MYLSLILKKNNLISFSGEYAHIKIIAAITPADDPPIEEKSPLKTGKKE
jgi:hypothetical protein